MPMCVNPLVSARAIESRHSNYSRLLSDDREDSCPVTVAIITLFFICTVCYRLPVARQGDTSQGSSIGVLEVTVYSVGLSENLNRHSKNTHPVCVVTDSVHRDNCDREG